MTNTQPPARCLAGVAKATSAEPSGSQEPHVVPDNRAGMHTSALGDVADACEVVGAASMLGDAEMSLQDCVGGSARTARPWGGVNRSADAGELRECLGPVADDGRPYHAGAGS